MLYDAEAKGWDLFAPHAINNAGQMVGYGIFQGERHIYLLSPVPEPETYAFMLAGLAVTGWLARRRNRAS